MSEVRQVFCLRQCLDCTECLNVTFQQELFRDFSPKTSCNQLGSQPTTNVFEIL